MESSESANASSSAPQKATTTSTTVSSNSGDVLTKNERITQSRLEPLGVTVETNIEKAMKILKRKLIKEGLFKELKTRKYFEKPSEKRKRKQKETMKKIRKDEARARKNSLM